MTGREPGHVGVGNDVVDLRDPDTDPSRPRDRFDARVLGPDERRALLAAPDPSRERWSFWAAKEASYKLLRQRCADTVFSPVRFAVSLDALPGPGARGAHRTGWVRHGVHRIAVAIAYVDGAVHAVATSPDAGETSAPTGEIVSAQERLVARDAVAATPAGLSAAVRRLAIDRVAARLGVAPARLAIGKRDRIPELRLDGAPCDADLSLSHHGGVVAFACRLHAGHLPAAHHPVPHLPTAHARRRLAS